MMLKIALLLGAAYQAKAQCGPDDLQNVHDSCCPPGVSCTDDLPSACSGNCSSIFLDFDSNCQELITSSGAATAAEFDNFAQLCRSSLQGCRSDSECGTHAQCAPLMGCTVQPCSRCLCEYGYTGDGTVCTQGDGPPPPPAPDNLATARATPLPTTGTPVQGSITQGADIYSLSVSSGGSYTLIVELGDISDTVVEVWGSDRSTYLGGNDDANGGLGSQYDFVAELTGTLYVAVRGYSSSQRGSYSITATGSAGGDLDACGAGMPQVLRETSGVVEFTDSAYTDGQTCQWFINCRGRANHANVQFTVFDTEANYDFIDIFDGRAATATSLAHISGSLENLEQDRYAGSSHQMLVQFTTDGSVTHGGFSFTYTCGSDIGPVGPPTGSDTPIVPGVPTQGTVARAGTYQYFTFQAQAGQDYTIETQLVGASPLEDSVVEVFDDVGHTNQIAMNDDGPETSDPAHNMASFLVWTAPATATYYVGVRGFSTAQTGQFVLTVSQSLTNACLTGDTVQGSGSISFTGDQYVNQAHCMWTVQCPFGQVATVNFQNFDTESNYDFVNLYDGPSVTSPQAAHLSGSTMPDPSVYVGSQSSMFVEFTADGSVTGGGFELEFNCGPAGVVDGGAPSATTCTPIRIASARPAMGELTATHGTEYFCLQADSTTQTYDISVVLGSLSDSIMSIYDGASGWPVDAIAVNDDAGGSLASNIQFSPPAPGLYYVAVTGFGGATGDFTMDIQGDDSSDAPCDGGSTMGSDSGVISFDSDQCTNGCTCSWTIPCTRGNNPSVTFNEFSTEANYDYVKLFDCGNQRCGQIANFSGTAGSPNVPVAGMSYTGSNPRMTIAFTSDTSVYRNNNFEIAYQCGGTGPVGPSTGALTVGSSTSGSISSGPARYSLAATAGTTYEITVTLGTLSDSVLTVYDTDGSTTLVVNDDYGGGLASYVEWTAPNTGTYTVEVRGYGSTDRGSFSVEVDGGASIDPCGSDSGAALPGDSGTVTYMPEGQYGTNLNCLWHVSCSGSNDVASLTFTGFDTESSWDFVNIYSGSIVPTAADSPQAHLSGSIDDLSSLSYSSSSPQMTVQFTTDGSVARGGFSAEYTCGAATGGTCVDHIEELSGANACERYMASGYTCATNFCETCGFNHQCDLTCGYC